MKTSSTRSTPAAAPSERSLGPALDRCQSGVVFLEATTGAEYRFRCALCGGGTRFRSVVEWASLLFERRKRKTT